MKVRVCYTVVVDDDYRKAISQYYGQPGLATRQDVKDWLRDYGSSMDADLSQDLQDRKEEADAKDR